MPVPESLKSPFIPGNHYHVVFKSIDGILLFRNENEYNIFLERLMQFTGWVFDMWAYCLLNNHVHFIIKTKPLQKIIAAIRATDKSKQTVAMKKLLTTPDDAGVFDEMVERQVNSFLVSYANYTKNKYHHDGGLFQSPFKRIQIDTEAHLQMAIIYVHANTLKHKIFNDYTTYPNSSYAAICANSNLYCVANEVLQFFGGVDKYVLLHSKQVNYYYNKGFPNSKLE